MSTTQGYGLTISERIGASPSRFHKLEEAINRRLRVAIPGIVQSFNAAKQTVTVLPALNEEVRIGGVPTKRPLPLLADVPVVLPRAGGFTLTLPIEPGDECLVVFADMSVDSWWQQGAGSAGASQPQDQATTRRHDLSDGFAIMGCWSQPRVLPSYSTSSAQLRKDDGTVKIDVAANQVTVTAQTVQVNASGQATVSGSTVNVTGSAQVNVSGSGNTIIEGRNFLTHTHSGVQSGGSTSGPVV
ncbi:MAG TPA: Gp138 family membrane-puncturing spike protein [Bryobacteraceae bacterium]|jgi:phage baseplate assembly protein gpV|nr:Gp138 family membrane-puncturing spike protein [Bryobacteraceae bacterium]